MSLQSPQWLLVSPRPRRGGQCAATSLPPSSLLVRLSSLLEQIAEVLKLIPQELFQLRVVEPVVDVPVPPTEFVGVREEIVEAVPQSTEDIVEVTQRAPHERMQE